MIEVRHIHHAVTLAKHRNFARAAAVLGISQPALTRSIQVLEEHLGVKLFDRHPRNVVPTAFGQLLIERGQDILKANQNLQRELDLLRGVEIGELHVGAGPYAARVLLGPVMARFLREFPQIKVTVHVEGWPNLAPSFYEGQLDLFVGDTVELEGREELTLHRLSRYDGVFFCRHDHPLLAEASLTAEKLAQYPLALPAVLNARLHSLFCVDGTCSLNSAQLEQLHRITCNNIYLLKTVVEQSEAFGVAAPIMIEDELQNGRLAILPFKTDELFGVYGYALPEQAATTPAAETFIRLLREHDVELARRCSEIKNKFS